MVVIAKTANKLIRIREFHIDYVGHAQMEKNADHWENFYRRWNGLPESQRVCPRPPQDLAGDHEPQSASVVSLL
jgi:hypothetical protein